MFIKDKTPKKKGQPLLSKKNKGRMNILQKRDNRPLGILSFCNFLPSQIFLHHRTNFSFFLLISFFCKHLGVNLLKL